MVGRNQVTISPDPEVTKWIDARTGLGKRFRNRTHAFEFAVAHLMGVEEETGRIPEAAEGATKARAPR